MGTLVYPRLPESYGRHVTKVAIKNAIEVLQAIVWIAIFKLLKEHHVILVWILVLMTVSLIWPISVKIWAAANRKRREREANKRWEGLVMMPCAREAMNWEREINEREIIKSRPREIKVIWERKINDSWEREANKLCSTLKQIEFVEAIFKLLKEFDVVLVCILVLMTVSLIGPIFNPKRWERGANKRWERLVMMPFARSRPRVIKVIWEREAKQIEFVEAIFKLLNPHVMVWILVLMPVSLILPISVKIWAAAAAKSREREANKLRESLAMMYFARKAMNWEWEIIKSHPRENKETSERKINESWEREAKQICKAKLTQLENNTLSGNTTQQTHTAPAPGAPSDDGNCVPPSTPVGASIDADPNHIENPGDELSSSTEASPAQAPDITKSSSNGACDDGNRTQPSKQMVMALSSTDPASVGASIDDDPNHIEKPGDEPSSSMESPPAHAPDVTSSSNGACDNGNLAPPSTQMPMALPSDEPVSVGASIDDPNHIDNPGDEPSSSTEASRAHVPDITSSSNGACDDGNPAPPSTLMPVALPINDPAPVGGSSDDNPNGIENPSDESSRSMEASPAHPPDITPSSNGASPPVREDDSERREPPVPRDIENQHDRNENLQAMPKEVLLMFALQAFQILSNVKSKDISLLSRKAEILQYCAEALTVIGFFCGLGVILLRNQRNLRAATNIMSRIGFYITGMGFIATLCVQLGKSMFWIFAFIGFLFSALYTYALWEGWLV